MTPYEQELLEKYLAHLNVIGYEGDYPDFEAWYQTVRYAQGPGHDSPYRDQGVREPAQGLGTMSGQTAAAGGCPHRRCAGGHPTHRFTVSPAGTGPGNSPAGRRPRQGRPGPGVRPLRRRPAPERDGGVDLGRRGALGRRQRPHHRGPLQDRCGGPGRAVVAITSVTMRALDAVRPVGVGSGERVFGLSASQITRRVKAVAKAAGLAGWESFSGHSGRVGMARRMAQNGAPTHEIERQGRWKQGGGMVGRYTRGESAGSALRYP